MLLILLILSITYLILQNYQSKYKGGWLNSNYLDNSFAAKYVSMNSSVNLIDQAILLNNKYLAQNLKIVS